MANKDEHRDAVWTAATTRVADLLDGGLITMDIGPSRDDPEDLEILFSDPSKQSAIGSVLRGLDAAGYPNRLASTPDYPENVISILVGRKPLPFGQSTESSPVDQEDATTQPERRDSRPYTLLHSRRVGELMGELIKEMLDRSYRHDLSKLHEPELEAFDRYSPEVNPVQYGTDEYERRRQAIKPALDHHYAAEPHHPEHHPDGVRGMTLVDLAEMLADWRASTERYNSNFADSLDHNRKRFKISDELFAVLLNTARAYGWLDDQQAP